MARFLDARQSEVPGTLTTDVCIVGAGAAGMTLALQLAAAGVDVLLLESGGESIEAETQGLYAAEQAGTRYFDLSACRLRFLGGTTNHWAGYCRENDPIDFAGRPELGVMGWPVGYRDVRPYVERAAQSLGLDMSGWAPEPMARRAGFGADTLIESQSKSLQTKIFQFAKRLRFREIYRDELQRAPTLSPVLHANVTHIQLDETGKAVKHLTVRTLNQRQLRVRARTFVLAAHAVENARLMLASNDVQLAGVGNDTGHVGRHFMEHPVVESGFMFPSARFPRFYDVGTARRYGLSVDVSLTEQAMRTQGTLSYYCRFSPVVAKDETLAAIESLRSGFWRPADVDAIQALGRVLADIPGVIRYLDDRRFASGVIAPKAYRLRHRIEQAPNPDSRVSLSTQRDRLGSPLAKLEWRLSSLDHQSIAKGQAMVAKEFTRLGLGTFRLAELTPELIDASVEGVNHHGGTTRMAASAKDGVVDRDGKVHGIDNLYVAGSSIFPTMGYSGPTMMLIAFAMRLGDHLVKTRRLA
jgi:choline dehydrogenase-like flavoprotein